MNSKSQDSNGCAPEEIRTQSALFPGTIARKNIHEGSCTLGGKEEQSVRVAANTIVASILQATDVFLGRVVDMVLVWWQRHRDRRELRNLLSLDERTLDDIGVNRFSLAFETAKRFWQPPGPVTYPTKSFGSSRAEDQGSN
jgi:uncharacterized protein YjiS (DUF1127 family)